MSPFSKRQKQIHLYSFCPQQNLTNNKGDRFQLCCIIRHTVSLKQNVKQNSTKRLTELYTKAHSDVSEGYGSEELLDMRFGTPGSRIRVPMIGSYVPARKYVSLLSSMLSDDVFC